MNWKEFFRPTKEKIILFIVLIFIGVIIGSGPLMRIDPDPRPQEFTKFIDSFEPTWTVFLSPIILPFSLMEGYAGIYPSWMILIFFIIDVIFWYLISCLIIFAFNKFKDKNKLKRGEK